MPDGDDRSRVSGLFLLQPLTLASLELKGGRETFAPNLDATCPNRSWLKRVPSITLDWRGSIFQLGRAVRGVSGRLFSRGQCKLNPFRPSIGMGSYLWCRSWKFKTMLYSQPMGRFARGCERFFDFLMDRLWGPVQRSRSPRLLGACATLLSRVVWPGECSNRLSCLLGCALENQASLVVRIFFPSGPILKISIACLRVIRPT